jgi:hypothetical protein
MHDVAVRMRWPKLLSFPARKSKGLSKVNPDSVVVNRFPRKGPRAP